jgi:hypothetical protein
MSPRKFAVVTISPTDMHHVGAFEEVAETLHAGLLTLGYDSILSKQAYQVSRQAIILGANLLSMRPQPIHPSSILYNLEQVDTGSGWLNPLLLDLYKRHVVWDYDTVNAARWASYGIQVSGVLPIGYTPSLSRITAATIKDIDVLFIGALSQRRNEVLLACQSRGLKTHRLFGVYGADRDRYIARSKVLLNVHNFEAKVLEMVRLSYWMANGGAIVTESGSDANLVASLANAVCFTNYDDLPNACLDLVHDDLKQKALGQNARAWIQARPIEAYLVKLLQ